ncbi:hypothetical protein R9X47_27785 [Wukongibacter baidiensis]|uniref:hypothetical protein n=1 Tax=Wukongibacter baidiensis TaxID=1723361 RepID=UPI003D7F7D2E
MNKEKKKSGNIFEKSEYSTSTIFDKSYDIIKKAAEVYRPEYKEKKSDSKEQKP